MDSARMGRRLSTIPTRANALARTSVVRRNPSPAAILRARPRAPRHIRRLEEGREAFATLKRRTRAFFKYIKARRTKTVPLAKIADMLVCTAVD